MDMHTYHFLATERMNALQREAEADRLVGEARRAARSRRAGERVARRPALATVRQLVARLAAA